MDVAALTAYLTDALDRPPHGDLSVDLIAGGRSNPTYALTDGQRAWILRRPPYGDYVKSGHDMGREVTVITALSDTSVPVPTVVAYCQDEAVLGAPFYVMDRIGDSPDLSLSAKGVELRERMVDLMNDVVLPAEREYHQYRAQHPVRVRDDRGRRRQERRHQHPDPDPP